MKRTYEYKKTINDGVATYRIYDDDGNLLPAEIIQQEKGFPVYKAVTWGGDELTRGVSLREAKKVCLQYAITGVMQ